MVVHAVIPASGEMEIGEWLFEAYKGKKLARHYIKHKLNVVTHTCNQEVAVGKTGLRPAQGNAQDL